MRILFILFVIGFCSLSLCLKPPAWVEGGLFGYNPSGRMDYSAIQSSNKRDLWLFGGYDGNYRKNFINYDASGINCK